MRIACVYLPSFPLQAHVRQAPHLAGAPVAVADAGCTGATVVACSRAAWEEGIRPSMAVATARVIAPALCVLSADHSLYERALGAVFDTSMSLCEAVDAGSEAERAGPHRVLYMRVPPRMRGDSFGQKILAQLARQGFRGRVGVADDRFTAYVAAVTVTRRGGLSRLDADAGRPPLFHQSCTTVPRGGSAAFLAPLPLSYLPIDPDVQRMLHTCGVKTLGDFAALPPPSVSRAWMDVDFRALARGNGPSELRGLASGAILGRPVSERLAVPAAGAPARATPVEARDPDASDAPAEMHEPGASDAPARDEDAAAADADAALLGALRVLCDRIAHRLDGRDRLAAKLTVRLVDAHGELAVLHVEPGRATASSRELLEAIHARLGELGSVQGLILELEVAQEAEPAAAEMELFAGSGHRSGPVAPATPAPDRPDSADPEAHEPARDRHLRARLGGGAARLTHRHARPTRRRARRRPQQQQLF